PILAAKMAASGENYLRMLQALGKKTNTLPDPNALVLLSTDTNRNISLKPKEVYQGFVPDLKGLSVKDAVYNLETEGMKVTLQGKGTVQGQTIPPGAKIKKGQNITLLLG